jgi:hypothetical protein
MEEAIVVLADFKPSEVQFIKRTLHEEAIVKLFEWKTRHAKRQNPEVDEDGNPAVKQGGMKGNNTANDLALCMQAFPSA